MRFYGAKTGFLAGGNNIGYNDKASGKLGACFWRDLYERK